MPGGRGVLGLVRCPGSVAAPGDAMALEQDLGAIAAVGTTMLVTLLDDDELSRLGAGPLPAACRARGIEWARCPIFDLQVPGADFEQAWSSVGPRVHARLDRDEVVTLHCRAGLGRTGTIAARVLCERGIDAREAIGRVRLCRPGTIETAAQERYLLDRAFDLRTRDTRR
jgi:ADP-ribosyl-[dinitrogen reductase] hydrolase